MDTSKELINPRYKVVADFPGNWNPVGTIIEFFGLEEPKLYTDGTVYLIESYPHLFKKLEWWEDRKPEEMPEYVKVIEDGSFTRLKGDIYEDDAYEELVNFPPAETILKAADGYRWEQVSTAMYLVSETNEWVEIHGSLLKPATVAEYEAFINQPQKNEVNNGQQLG